MVTYCFDVDGTLTPSRSVMDEEFRQEFLEFQKENNVCLVTGSDYPKTLEQVGQEVIDNCKLVFNCCANEVRDKSGIRYKSTWKPGGLLILNLEGLLKRSDFPIRTGNHIEVRTGCLNFSVVGRNATKEDRAKYVEWDKQNQERINFADIMKSNFPELDFTIAGETGIDIYPKGRDKSQVREWIYGNLVFIGDRCEKGGNDHPLAIVSDIVYNVKDWKDTQAIIKGLQENGR